MLGQGRSPARPFSNHQVPGFKRLVAGILDGKLTNISRVIDYFHLAANEGQACFLFPAGKADAA
jgi:hypothetical protein